jgi:RNA polymerase sigma-70 factor (ECF subfamily)
MDLALSEDPIPLPAAHEEAVGTTKSLASGVAAPPNSSTGRKGADPVLEAFTESYGDLLRHIEQRVGHAADAADIVQEAYIRLQSSRRSEAVGNPKAFIYRVAGNLAIDHLRRRNHRAGIFDRDAVLENVASEEPSVERRAIGYERLARLLDAIADLPPRCREVFMLRKIHHLEFAQIEQRLGISRSMVEQHLQKALLRCAVHLGELD